MQAEKTFSVCRPAYKDMKSHHYLNMPACTGKILLAIIY